MSAELKTFRRVLDMGEVTEALCQWAFERVNDRAATVAPGDATAMLVMGEDEMGSVVVKQARVEIRYREVESE
jgi:hypothetical protein